MSSNKKKKQQYKNDPIDQSTYQTPAKHSQKSQRARPQSAGYSQHYNMSHSTIFAGSPHPDQCLCKQCICGRHLCKFTSPSPSLIYSTTYRNHYPSRNPYKHNHGPHQIGESRLNDTPLLSNYSTYMQHYPDKEGDLLERPKPNDLLKCSGGPVNNLTSYSNQFPGHRGKNQYVPMNPELFRGGLPFAYQTSYSRHYPGNDGKSASKARPPDQFSMTGSWFGSSSYKNQFQNPKNHQHSNKKSEKVNQSRSLAQSRTSQRSHDQFNNPPSHFQTTYKNDFLRNNSTICPAALSKQNRNTLNKSNYKDNSNFKGMDRKYESLAKHHSYK